MKNELKKVDFEKLAVEDDKSNTCDLYRRCILNMLSSQIEYTQRYNIFTKPVEENVTIREMSPSIAIRSHPTGVGIGEYVHRTVYNFVNSTDKNSWCSAIGTCPTFVELVNCFTRKYCHI